MRSQILKIVKHLLDPADIVRFAINLYGVGFQLNCDIQAVFQQVKIFITGTKEGFDIGTKFDVFLHREIQFTSGAGYADSCRKLSMGLKAEGAATRGSGTAETECIWPQADTIGQEGTVICHRESIKEMQRRTRPHGFSATSIVSIRLDVRFIGQGVVFRQGFVCA
jgi:hypothetical protein